jgi:hypothetical protein
MFDPFTVQNDIEEAEFMDVTEITVGIDNADVIDLLTVDKNEGENSNKKHSSDWQSFSLTGDSRDRFPFWNKFDTDRFHHELLEQQQWISEKIAVNKSFEGDTTIESEICEKTLNQFFHVVSNSSKNNKEESRTDAFLKRIARSRESLMTAESNGGNNITKIKDTVRNYVRRHSSAVASSTDEDRESILSFPRREPAIEFLKQEQHFTQSLENDHDAKNILSSSPEKDIFLSLVGDSVCSPNNASTSSEDDTQNKYENFSHHVTITLSADVENDGIEVAVESPSCTQSSSKVVKITATSDHQSLYEFDSNDENSNKSTIDIREPSNAGRSVVSRIRSVDQRLTVSDFRTPISYGTSDMSATTTSSGSEKTRSHISSYEIKNMKKKSENHIENFLDAAAPFIGDDSIRSIRKVAERFGMALDDATHADMEEPPEETFYLSLSAESASSIDTASSTRSSTFSSSQSFRKRNSSGINDLESYGSLLDSVNEEQEYVTSESQTVELSLSGDDLAAYPPTIDLRAVHSGSLSDMSLHNQKSENSSERIAEMVSNDHSDGMSRTTSRRFFGSQQSDGCFDERPEKPRNHHQQQRSRSDNNCPLGASVDEIENINKFLKIAGASFDGSQLSIEEREDLHDKAQEAGLPEAFINRILDQSAGIITTWEQRSVLSSIDEDDENYCLQTTPTRSHQLYKPCHCNLSPDRSLTKNPTDDHTKATIATSYSDCTSHEEESGFRTNSVNAGGVKKGSSWLAFLKTFRWEPPISKDELLYFSERVNRNFETMQSSRNNNDQRRRYT